MQEAKPAYVEGQNLDTLWAAVQAAPEDPAAHERFINFAVLGRRHEEAIARYRSWGETQPEHRALADKYKVALAMRVAAQLLIAVPRPTIDRNRARGAAVMIGLGVVLLAVGLSARHLIGWGGPILLALGISELRRARAAK